MVGVKGRGGGHRPGSGRKPGSPNKATVERIAALSGSAVPAKIPAQIKARTVEEAAGEPELGKKTLARFTAIYVNMAGVAQAQMVAAEQKNDRAAWAAAIAEFEKWSKAAVWTADKLAPMQSPSYRAIQVIAGPSDPAAGAKTINADNVVPLNDPNGAARVYLRIVKAGGGR